MNSEYTTIYYIENSFTMLISLRIKLYLKLQYCIGFLYVIFIPIVTLCLQKEIRVGIATVFGSAVMCLQLQEIRRSNSAQQATSEGRDVQSQLQTI